MKRQVAALALLAAGLGMVSSIPAESAAPTLGTALISQLSTLRELRSLKLTRGQMQAVWQVLSQLRHSEESYAAREAHTVAPVLPQLRRVTAMLQAGKMPEDTDLAPVNAALDTLKPQRAALEKQRQNAVTLIRQQLTRPQLDTLRELTGLPKRQPPPVLTPNIYWSLPDTGALVPGAGAAPVPRSYYFENGVDQNGLDPHALNDGATPHRPEPQQLQGFGGKSITTAPQGDRLRFEPRDTPNVRRILVQLGPRILVTSNAVAAPRPSVASTRANPARKPTPAGDPTAQALMHLTEQIKALQTQVKRLEIELAQKPAAPAMRPINTGAPLPPQDGIIVGGAPLPQGALFPPGGYQQGGFIPQGGIIPQGGYNPPVFILQPPVAADGGPDMASPDDEAIQRLFFQPEALRFLIVQLAGQ